MRAAVSRSKVTVADLVGGEEPGSAVMSMEEIVPLRVC